MPLVALSNVVFPEPLGQMSPSNWPLVMLKETEFRAWLPPKAILALATLKTSGAVTEVPPLIAVEASFNSREPG